MNTTPLVRHFAKGEAVIYTYHGRKPAKVVGYANRTPFDERANYRVDIGGTVRTVNEHWLEKIGAQTAPATTPDLFTN